MRGIVNDPVARRCAPAIEKHHRWSMGRGHVAPRSLRALGFVLRSRWDTSPGLFEAV